MGKLWNHMNRLKDKVWLSWIGTWQNSEYSTSPRLSLVNILPLLDYQ